MNATERFVRDRNLSRFVGQLEVEYDPSKRETLRKVLIAEEDRFGSRCERLQKTEELISRSQARILELSRLIANHSNPEHVAVHEKVLATQVALLDIYTSYRQTLAEAVDRSAL